MSAILSRIAIVGALTSMCIAAVANPARAGDTMATSDDRLLDLTITLPEDRWFRTDQNIPILVTVTNKSSEELVACFENSDVQKHLITFRLHDETGIDVTSDPKLHVDYGIAVEVDTVVLSPFGNHFRTLSLEREVLPRGGGCRKLNVVGVYHCPVSTNEEIAGRRRQVATGVIVSRPVSIRLDSRNWLSRVIGGDCP